MQARLRGQEIKGHHRAVHLGGGQVLFPVDLEAACVEGEGQGGC